MLGPSHPDANARCTAIMIHPCKTRDSARSALQTAVRNRRSGLALHPPEGYYPALRPLTGAAEYAWGARACRHNDRRGASTASSPSPGQDWRRPRHECPARVDQH
eukprot:scaffold7239_cov21-Phaeocystis_antarctica.AAC.1